MMFWDLVKDRIRSQGTTQAWIASKVNVGPEKISRWIKNDVMPNADQAVIIAQALNTTVEFLVTGSDTTDPWVREHSWLIKHLKELPQDQYFAVEQTVVSLAVRAMKAKRQSEEISS